MADEPNKAATPSAPAKTAAPSAAAKTTPTPTMGGAVVQPKEAQAGASPKSASAAAAPASPKPHGAPATPTKTDPDAIPSHGLPKNTRLTDKQIDRLSRSELAAIATDRGYRLNVAGVRVTREAFRAEQKKDTNLGK